MVQRMKIKDIIETDITSFKKDGSTMSVYYCGDRKTVAEVSFVKERKDPKGLAGCSYMMDLWTPSALKRIAEIAEKAGVPRKNKY